MYRVTCIHISSFSALFFSEGCFVLQVIRLVCGLLLVTLLNSEVAESRKSKTVGTSFEYKAINCRAYSASLTDFGGVGDGKTSNTKAFKSAISHLSEHASKGGSQLYVPAGKWLTGSFSLTSHFTLYLHKDAVLLASQVSLSFCSFFDEKAITNMRFMTWPTSSFLICSYYTPVSLAEISYIDYLIPLVSVNDQISQSPSKPFTRRSFNILFVCVSNNLLFTCPDNVN